MPSDAKETEKRGNRKDRMRRWWSWAAHLVCQSQSQCSWLGSRNTGTQPRPHSRPVGWCWLSVHQLKRCRKIKREREKCHCCVTATKSNKQETSSSVPILKIYFHFPFILLLTTLYYYQTFQQFVVFMLSGRSKKLKRSFAPSIKLQLRARTSHLLTAGGLF